MKKLLLCLTTVICFSLLNVATAKELERSLQRCNEENNGPLCYWAGFFYQNKQNYPLAKQYYEKSCDLNYGEGCTALGFLYKDGEGVRQDYQQAKTYFEQGCNTEEVLHNDGFSDGMGCVELGLFYDNGEVVKQDYQQAKLYYEKACNMNNRNGCFGLGTLYKTGRGVRQNFQTAKEYYGKACDLGLQYGCDHYRKLNEKGY